MHQFDLEKQILLLGQQALAIVQKQQELDQLKKQFEIDQARANLLQEIKRQCSQVVKKNQTTKNTTNEEPSQEPKS